MHCFIPPELEQVESHLTWMKEIIPYLERSMLERSETLEEHIHFLEKNSDQAYNDGDIAIVTDENFEEMYNEENPVYCAVYASRLNEAMKLTYLNKFKEAQQQLVLLEKIYDKLESFHREAFIYAVDALKWSMKVWKNIQLVEISNSSDEDESALEVEVVEDPASLQAKWKKLQEDEKAKAALKYLWGCIGQNLKMTEECLSCVFDEVLKLDPDYHIWYALVYRTMRGIRRNFHRNKTGALEPPSDREQKMCKEAFQRKPNIFLSMKNMAMMLKEVLWNLDQSQWDANEPMYIRCQLLFEKALEIAKERNQKEWTTKVQVYLAEFLLFGRGSLLDQDEGKRIFDECLAANSKDTTVLHKVGKLCHYGSASRGPDYEKKFKDWKLAEQFYRCAIFENPSNFPCVKDCLKLLCYKKNFKEYIKVIDRVVGEMKRDYQVQDLKIVRGLVIWIFNPFSDRLNKEKACDTWLYIVSLLPDSINDLYKSILKPPFAWSRNEPCIVEKDDLISTLEGMIKNCPKWDEERKDALNSFLSGFKERCESSVDVEENETDNENHNDEN